MDYKILNIETNIVNKPIVLVGMMGSGKSHIGRMLAKTLGVQFCDMDALIEDEQSTAITNIFEEYGEVHFRALETSKLEELLEAGAYVISTGGGVVTTPKNLETIKLSAISIWLKSDMGVMLERVSGDEGRPLLNNDNPAQALELLLNAREALYSTADIHISNNGNDDTRVVQDIIKELEKYN